MYAFAFCAIFLACISQSQELPKEFLNQLATMRLPPPDPHHDKQSIGTPKKSDDAEFLATIIDGIALMYTTVRIYRRYHQGPLVTPQKRNWLMPHFVITLSDRGRFLMDVLTIVSTVMVYKTIAQLIITCGSGDLGDAIAMVIKKGKKIATSIFV